MTTNFISLQFRYSKEEYVAAVRQYYQTFHSKTGALFCAAMVVLGLIILFLSDDPYFSSLLISLGTFGLMIFGVNYFRGPQRIYERNPKLHEEYNLQFSDEGIIFRSKDIDSAVQWSLYSKIQETERFYFLIYGKDSFTLVPKRVFTSGEQEFAFRVMLKDHIDPTFAPGQLAESSNQQEYVPRSLEPPDWR